MTPEMISAEPRLAAYMQQAKAKLPSVTPLYYIVYSALSTAIDRGYYANGERMPSTECLGKIFDVSSTTITAATKLLIDDASVQVKRGKGVYVLAKSTSAYTPPSASASIVADLKKEIISDSLCFEVPESVAAEFGSTTLVCLKKTVCLGRSSDYNPHQKPDYQTHQRSDHQAISYELVWNRKVASEHEPAETPRCSVGICRAPANIAEHLSVKPDSHILLFTKRYLDNDSGELYMLSYTYLRSQEVDLNFAQELLTAQ